MPERTYTSSNGYRFGFGGQEKDDEISGNGNSYTAEFWEYDARLGRRWNRDPVVKVWESPYAAFANNPIYYNDPNGADVIGWLKHKWNITKNAFRPKNNPKKQKYTKYKTNKGNTKPKDQPKEEPKDEGNDRNSGEDNGSSDKTKKDRSWEFYYGLRPKATTIASSQPVTFHNTSMFSKKFPYIKPDEPATQIAISVIVPTDNPSIDYGFGFFDYHLKPDELSDGLYLANGYTQIGGSFSVYYRPDGGPFSCNLTVANGFMFSNPDYRGNPNVTYVAYKNLTPFLPNSYQVTGYGGTVVGMINYKVTKNYSVYFGATVHGDVSRPLRSSDGTSQRLNTLSGTIVAGAKFTIK